MIAGGAPILALRETRKFAGRVATTMTKMTTTPSRPRRMNLSIRFGEVEIGVRFSVQQRREFPAGIPEEVEGEADDCESKRIQSAVIDEGPEGKDVDDDRTEHKQAPIAGPRDHDQDG